MGIRAFRVHEWMRHFFNVFGIWVEHSEPGRRCSRLIRQFDEIQGCRVLKVRGARELIRAYGPDQSFTRNAGLGYVRGTNPPSGFPFQEFESLKLRPGQKGSLTPEDVLQYLVSKGVFRIGLDLKRPNCELVSWIPLDDVKTMSVCTYCGLLFDVTHQLKDREVCRYRRSGLFGRDDSQLGIIPAALALQQLDTNLHGDLLMYSTALNFEPRSANIENCEADFVAVVVGRPNIDKPSVQIVIGETKSGNEINADDVRKLGTLADAIPSEIAKAFIMFAKTGTFTQHEVALAQSLNSPGKERVILWSQDELEPYFVYQRAGDRLGDIGTSSLTEMVQATNKLFFVS